MGHRIRTNRLLRSAAAVALACLPMAGCLERLETIRVSESGAVTLSTTFRGDADDLKTGDAIPDGGVTKQDVGGWATTDFQDKDADGKPRANRTATLEVRPGGVLPDAYAPAGDARHEVCLKFPTSLAIERRADGVYYHFKRVYLGREDARYTWMKRAMEESPQFKALKDKDPKTLSDADRRALVDAFKKLEIDKQMKFVDAGLATLTSRPQDLGLEVRAALMKYADTLDSRMVANLLIQPESEERDATIQAVAKSFLAGARTALDKALQDAGLTPAEQSSFLAAFDVESARRAVTEDLADERWDVKVEMPGTIVASNADEVEGTTAKWQFVAGAIMDRDQVLMVTSRVSSTK